MTTHMQIHGRITDVIPYVEDTTEAMELSLKHIPKCLQVELHQIHDDEFNNGCFYKAPMETIVIWTITGLLQTT